MAVTWCWASNGRKLLAPLCGISPTCLYNLSCPEKDIAGHKRAASYIRNSSKWLQHSVMKGRSLLIQMVNYESGGCFATTNVVVEDLLAEFGGLFEEPKGLPPHRSCDHKIILKDGTQPISTRPYRYPFYQKTEIEKLVAEMLKTGMIRPSSSPFSSPVLLVRKVDGS